MHRRSLLALVSLVVACSNSEPAPQAQPEAAPLPTLGPLPALSAELPAPSVSAPPQQPELSPGARIENEKNTIDVFKVAAPSVVFVTQNRMVVDYSKMRALELPSGSGSGFVWDADGHIVTNYHVIRGAQKLKVTLYNQRSFEAKVVGVEPRKDIAVLKIPVAGDTRLTPIGKHPSGYHLEVGQKAIAIGNPFGLDHTLTTGIVSALGREVRGVGGVTIRDMVQTDAAINPGNSGGPLLDSTGRLIGMNTMIFSKSGASAGIGFAVPASTVSRVVPQIIEHGRAEQVGLGIRIDPQGRLARQAGVKGVVVLGVEAASPAAKAGIQGIVETARGITLGDVLVAIDGQALDDYDDLYNTLDRHRAGDRIRLKVLRQGKTRTVPIELVRIQ